MRTYLDCVPCFVRQALDAGRMITDDEAVHEAVLRETLRLAADMPFNRPPPWMGQRIHRMLRERTGNSDPYAQAKRDANRLALELYPGLAERVARSTDPFTTAVRLAIAGNIIDLGVKSELDHGDVHRSIEHALEDSADPEAIQELRERVAGAREILYLADNAGEIVFDRLLIEQLPIERVTVVVKGSPVINDATRGDAEAAGLVDLVEVIDNGSDVPGTILELCAPAFRERFDRADLVIAKGQGNYETLSEAPARNGRKVFFLLKVKCGVIARNLGCPLGRVMVCHDGSSRGPGISLETTRKDEG